MPAEWGPHERTLMCWPARAALWGSRLEAARAEYAAAANAIAAFEPVLMVADPSVAASARAACGAAVSVVELPLDDSWARDSGPLFVVNGEGRRAGVDFAFNGWGEKFVPYDADAAFAARVLALLGEERVNAQDLVLEGGSISVDGEGSLVTTEQCLLEPMRNPGLSRSAIEARLGEALGVSRVVWLGSGLVEDRHTDGHVDNVCFFLEPGRVLLQTVADAGNPNAAFVEENRHRLRAAGLDVVELPWLPYLADADEPTVVPYTNLYLCNRAAIVPVSGAVTDADALAFLASVLPEREIVPVPASTLAFGGGGVHCITQQVPALRA